MCLLVIQLHYTCTYSMLGLSALMLAHALLYVSRRLMHKSRDVGANAGVMDSNFATNVCDECSNRCDFPLLCIINTAGVAITSCIPYIPKHYLVGGARTWRSHALLLPMYRCSSSCDFLRPNAARPNGEVLESLPLSDASSESLPFRFTPMDSVVWIFFSSN